MISEEAVTDTDPKRREKAVEKESERGAKCSFHGSKAGLRWPVPVAPSEMWLFPGGFHGRHGSDFSDLRSLVFFFDEGRSVGSWPQGSGCVWGSPSAAPPGPAWEL